MHASSIVFMSSIAVERSQGEKWDNYILSKSMTDKFLHRLSMDYGKYGLQCISVMPSMVNTPFVKNLKQAKSMLSPLKNF